MRVAFLALLLAASAGCSESTSPGTPSSQALNLTGTWTGDVAVENQTMLMTWMLTQSSTTDVAGPVTVGLPSGTILLNGRLTGTLAGSTLSYSIAIAPGGIPSRPTCVGQLTGSMAVVAGSAPMMNGSYAVASSSCPSPLSGGNLSLTRS